MYPVSSSDSSSDSSCASSTGSSDSSSSHSDGALLSAGGTSASSTSPAADNHTLDIDTHSSSLGTGDQKQGISARSVLGQTEESFCSSSSALNVFTISDPVNSSCERDDDEELLDEVLKNLNTCTDPVFADVVAASPVAGEALAAHFANPSGAHTSSSVLQRSVASAPKTSGSFRGTAPTSTPVPTAGAAVAVSTFQPHPTTCTESSLVATHGFTPSAAATQQCVNPATAANASMRVVYNAPCDYNQLRNAPHAHGHTSHGGLGIPQRIGHGSQHHHNGVPNSGLAAQGSAGGLTTHALAVHAAMMQQPWEPPDVAQSVDFNMPLHMPNMSAAMAHNPGHQHQQHLYMQELKPMMGTLHGASAMDMSAVGGFSAGDMASGNIAQCIPHSSRQSHTIAGGIADQYHHGDSSGSGRPGGFPASRLQVPKNVRLPQRRGAMQLWQFLLSLLDEADGDPTLVEWTDNSRLEFRLLNPEEVAIKWGEIKHRPAMNYDKLSRSLRYYYDKGIMQKVSGERYVYKFTCPPELLYRALGERESCTKPGLRAPIRRTSGLAASATMPQLGNSMLHSHSETTTAGSVTTFETQVFPTDHLMYSPATSSLLSPLNSEDSKSMMSSFNHFPYHMNHGYVSTGTSHPRYSASGKS